MEKFLKRDIDNLEILAAERSENLLEYTLEHLLELAEAREEAIGIIMETTQKKGDMQQALMNYVASYVVALADGTLVTKDYVEKGRSKQVVYLFLGTHWEAIDNQLYYVYIRKIARKVGLPDSMSEDPKFMCALYEKIAFMVIDYMKQRVPENECWVNLMNGTLEIKSDGTYLLREHRKADFFTYVLSYPYSKEAGCPRFMEFLDRVLPDRTTQDVVAEYIAYCFTKLKLSKMMVLSGFGANGKSVLLDVITGVLGSYNVSNISLSALTTDDEKRSHLEDKLANVSFESRGELDTAVLKQLISGEPTEVRQLYVGTHTMKNIPKLFTSYNRLPSPEYTYGFFRRWILVPFNVTIPEEEQDSELSGKLCKELSGIMNWVLEGLKRIMKNQTFSKSTDCNRALSDYINNSNSVMQFLDMMCVIDDSAVTTLPAIYGEYAKFCGSEDLKKYTKKNFKEIILNFGVKTKIMHKQSVYGLRIKSEDEL